MKKLIITILIIALIAVIFGGCVRTPSQKRLENISDIRLPKNFNVLKDEYQDMWQDYCVIYEIEFNDNSINELISSIKNSKYYEMNHNQEDQLSVEGNNPVWRKTDNGYYFRTDVNRTTYSIELDTIKNNLKYNECAD